MEGKKIDTITLNQEVFGVEVAPAVITRAVTAQRNQARSSLAHTKTRAERRGGGRKPWRQKGTGRARQGTIRAPQWRKGGIVFGPRNTQNFAVKLNKKERRKAIMGALSLAAEREGIIVIDGLKVDKIKTKPLAELMVKLPVKRKALMVIAKRDATFERSARNLAYVKTQIATNLNVLDLVGHHFLLIDKAALDVVEKTYLTK